MEKFDICIIGAGPGGYKAALILAKNGKKVCLVEKKEYHIGGTCLNEGCIPAKNFLESSNYIKKFSYFQNQGVQGDIKGFDFNCLKENTKTLIDTLRGGIEKKLQSNNVKIVYGKAEFLSEDEIRVESRGETIKADKFIIATGSISRKHPVLEFDSKMILSSDDIFSLEDIPDSLLIVGAGAIGCEFADFFNALGSKVHLCEFTPSILPLEDSDVSSIVQKEFKKRGIDIDTSANVISYKKTKDKVEVVFETKRGKVVKSYDKVLVSIGRIPNTSSMSIDNAKVQIDEKGFIETDFSLKTTNSNIYAIGDVTTSAALAHVAYYEAKKAAYDILGFKALNDSVVPNVVFTSPQVGSVGKNERYLKSNDMEYDVKKLFLRTLGMPKIKGDDSGFVKLLFDKKRKLLGASMVGYDMTEIINQVMICINTKLSLDDIKSMIFAHPTMSESFYKAIEG